MVNVSYFHIYPSIYLSIWSIDLVSRPLYYKIICLNIKNIVQFIFFLLLYFADSLKLSDWLMMKSLIRFSADIWRIWVGHSKMRITLHYLFGSRSLGGSKLLSFYNDGCYESLHLAINRLLLNVNITNGWIFFAWHLDCCDFIHCRLSHMASNFWDISK